MRRTRGDGDAERVRDCREAAATRGLELALACDYRVVINRPATVLGFPELEWGMIPCWGGTQRLPHLIGLDNSLHMLLAGQQVTANQALATRAGGRARL